MRARSVITRVLGAVAFACVLAVCVLYWIGAGGPGERWEEGEPTERALSLAALEDRSRAQAQTAASLAASDPMHGDEARQILFGDLHVHTTFSLDAFVMGLPIVGGDGARPVSDACDFARYCSGLDFWSLNDHAIGLTPWKWQQSVDAVRQCDAISSATHDVTPFLGWEWTQVGNVPENHYGHKNVVLRGLGDDDIPDRPIAAKTPLPLAELGGSRVFAGVLGVFLPEQDIFDLLETFDDTGQHPNCPEGVPVREQQPGCRDAVKTPAELYARLGDWGFDSIVVPHGTAWGSYTPPGSTWDKQLRGAMHDPNRQTLIEVFSGHGNSEEYRDWRGVEIAADGSRSCPDPTPGYLPGCWRAGEIITERCLAAGESADECAARAALAREHYVDAGLPGNRVVGESSPADWLDSGQCTDCFLPAFRYRPGGSAQYIMAVRDFEDPENPRRFEFGFIASSDNHSARPGTGYKEYGRVEMTETRLMRLDKLVNPGSEEPGDRPASSRPYVVTSRALDAADAEGERSSSFLQTGGLVAVHAKGRGRDAIWQALDEKEVYGTSGPRILLWFDLLNPAPPDAPASALASGPLAMGGETALAEAPIFRVRAAGSFEQKPGCPEESASALGPDRLARLCLGECNHPSDVRRPITRIEVVRIRPQIHPDEPVESLIEDPWQVLPCDGSGEGCVAEFRDPDFVSGQRDTLYYARAIEGPSPAVAADPLGCVRDESGRCAALDACADRPDSDDCLSPNEERAWSSPIFVAYRAGD